MDDVRHAHVPNVQLPAIPGVPSTTPDQKPPGFLKCPPGYRSPMSEDKLQHNHSERTIAECGVRCDSVSDCPAFRYSPGARKCVVLHGNVSSSDDPQFQLCEKQPLRHFAKAEAPLFRPGEFVEQEDGHIKIGDTIGLYAVGSSSLVWMTWLDQLHLTLRRLGYTLPVVPAERTPETYPRLVPTCDDTKYFQHLKTSRFGRIGWSSWDFAMNGWEGCGSDGFREVQGLRIKCQHGAGCVFSKNPLNVSDIGRDASRSNITLIATWFNDDQHWSTKFKCFDGKKTDWHEMLPITLHCLKNTVQAIRERNPHTWIIIMAKYPETFKHQTFKFIIDYNMKVKEAMEKLPRTLFVDYYMPNDKEGVFYQSPAHGGHPNCRGSKIMTYAVMDRLYKAKVLSRGIRLLAPDKENVLNGKCDELDEAGCHTSAVCWRDPEEQKCKPYQAGFFQKDQEHR